MIRRPSHKEVTGKIRAAELAVERHAIEIVNLPSVLADADDLGYTFDELSEVLAKLLAQATFSNYAGAHPPQKSYEEVIYGCDLFPFRVPSVDFGCTVYVKFAINDGSLWLVSLHRDRNR